MKPIHLLCLALALGACSRAANIGRPPQLTSPREGEEFIAMTNPPLEIPVDSGRPEAAASLWAGTTSSLITDRRAATRGDILTVVIQIDDRAEISNSSGRSRAAGDKMSMPQMAGIPQRLANKLPDGASFDNLADAKSSSTYKGSGNISRRDKLTLRVAATVTDRLPNGTLQIEGTQEVRVNYELRELTVSGFVRPGDIDRNNEIAYDRIAGARISYGGRGQITDVQQPRYGQQIADILLPY
ncbi:MAG: flagellar basal body L-ring protein FlgH [Paracoccus sp. (in: a-proteobacteria)]|jgi:flagellar L-ring protein precursor FlgH|uniref:flagellar basal body L-ring protein FlgH n=1 Tax=unclassified Paracoccus (in: a-proteobacteria) TaxID=2688777 RepID=UPI000C3627F7|nr:MULTISPECIES: flagellar basal body L-ring protein FlgH [unclassified Paracoccus (in: a-proteobacteria)]MAN55693.1 flagellar basal body L-ring protein [Paracoccus sp. (in: a-proteobacteria)]MBA47793.1 flagellar basal body L-ring protein [Paracoccus sp. (in: a-proteobacteria)]MCS5600862.1 flagellar basal body L-ring protein FlgH [Paracoccus sp. (in: a-proteobacteria)]MDB2490132.1 flagellar basal body L-ring protein FlgH [Paracoccus sp. (in: a-proteobacteria)]MDB2551719.1 flagellar basal body |tara:strand:- start:200 stop:925 length:726 start_codon:yes stop_codon:yes gene_type:complete